MPFYGPSGSSVAAASQAEQEAGTEAAKYVAPATAQFHPSAAKFWLKATANTTTLETSYNVTSVADTATGRMTATIATDFSGVDWCGLIDVEVASASPDFTFGPLLDSAPAAGTCVMENHSFIQSGATVELKDPTAWFLAGFGDQA